MTRALLPPGQFEPGSRFASIAALLRCGVPAPEIARLLRVKPPHVRRTKYLMLNPAARERHRRWAVGYQRRRRAARRTAPHFALVEGKGTA
jgi:hypothetical protein